MAAVAVEKVSHRYAQRTALDSVSLQIAPGQKVGLLGPNGSGKSTLLGLLSTRIALQEGSIKIFGQPPNQMRHKIGVVFQSPALDARLTVYENLRFAARLYGIGGHDRIEELLHQFRLRDRRHDLVKTLSGGLARRVELAKALLHKPELLLLDEPTTGLDPSARRELWELLGQLQTTLIVTTHLASEGELCDQVHILHQGKMVASGAPEQLQQEVGQDFLTLKSRHPLDLDAPCQEGTYRLRCTPQEAAQILTQVGPQLDSFTLTKPNLEDVFFQRTGANWQ